MYVFPGATFTKLGGIIYGSNASPDALKNTAIGGYYYAHAVFVSDNAVYPSFYNKKRNTTAITLINLDSRVAGMAGGWE
ncbi:hypothetical protein FACS1894141_4650 [Spirochaetia bacterium]|nr:hypothetical protein FACS1894141_4650 [Spirochaetia bacterium]